MKLIAYYDSYYNVLDSYDNANFNSQNERFAFTSIYDDYSYGTSILLTKDNLINGRTKISLNLKQDIHNEQGKKNQEFKKFEARSISVGLEQDFEIINSLFFVLGASYDILEPIFANNGELRPRSNSINPMFGVNYKHSENLNFYSHIARKSRFPTLKEFYSELLSTSLANPDLKSEHSLNFEIGSGWLISDILLTKFALFHNKVTDLIIFQNLPDNKRQYQNIGKAEFSGFELSAQTKFINIDIGVNYTFLYSENKSIDAESKILDGRPRHLFNLFIHQYFPFGFSWNIETNFTSIIYGTNPDNRSQVRLQDQFIQNIRIAQKFLDRIELFFRINNLFDRYYETEYGFPQPGRQFIIGLNLNSNDLKL